MSQCHLDHCRPHCTNIGLMFVSPPYGVRTNYELFDVQAKVQTILFGTMFAIW